MNRDTNTPRTDPRTAVRTAPEPATATATASTYEEKQTGADAPGFVNCGKPVENSRRGVKTYRPVEYRVVCAIARVQLLAQPSMTDADWKAAILETCAKQGWDNPSSDMLSRVMGAVECSVKQTMGVFRKGPTPAPPAEPKPDRAWTNADYRELAKTIRQIQARSAGATPTNVETVAREWWELSEPAALDQFYREAETDRFGALKRFAEIAIVRPPEWDVAAVRAESDRVMTPLSNWEGECFACRRQARSMVGHHVIQIQHGGSNYVRNRVRICEACHADIHPWLPSVPRASLGDWFRVGVIAPDVMALIKKLRQVTK